MMILICILLAEVFVAGYIWGGIKEKERNTSEIIKLSETIRQILEDSSEIMSPKDQPDFYKE